MARWARPSRNRDDIGYRGVDHRQLMDRWVELTDLVFDEAMRPAALVFMVVAVGWMLRHW